MGMIIVLMLGAYITLATLVILSISRFITKNRWVIGTLTAIAILIPTHDIIITNILGAYYCYSEPNPKTYISKKVEYPESIYWEDSVYPGFSAEDRKLMIMNYLDGVHLKTMALNGDDGKVYLYEVNASTVWEPLKALEYDSGKEYFDTVNEIAEHIMKTTQKIYTKETMPVMHYMVNFNEVLLPDFPRKFLYSDETKVIDNNTNENIAYNRRYMRFPYNIIFGFGEPRYYVQDSVCGENYFWFDYHVFEFNGVETSGKHTIGIEKYLYNKYIKGEK
jgi:hypothetical protein